MRIILADPPQKEMHYDLSYPNVGLLYLISYLEKKSSTPLEILYLEGHCDLEEHINRVSQFNPDVYGLSFALWTQELALQTINAVKDKLPDKHVICGGPQPTGAYEYVLLNSHADICVLGEGEETLLHLITAINGGPFDLDNIPGLAYRTSEGQVKVTQKRPYIKDLSSIPQPAWEKVDFSNYKGMHINQASPQTHIVVSRGCPYDCNFCANPVWKYNKPWVRMRTPEDIANEIKLLYDRGVREIYMTSDEFNVNEKWVIDTCKAIEDLQLNDIFFQCNIRADVFSEEIAAAFKRINLWLIHLGIESGNQRTLNGIGKHIAIEQVVKTGEICREYGISVFGFIMLYHAWEEDGRLCWESNNDVDNTLSFCRKLLSNGLIQYMSWQIATPMPGSRLWKTADKYCLIPDKIIDNVWSQNMLLPGINDKDIRWRLRKGMILKNYYLVRNGHVNLSHAKRIWQNLRVLAGMPPK